jgi:hypothetical protein
MRRDIELPHARAGILPYLALIAAVAVVWISAKLTVI